MEVGNQSYTMSNVLITTGDDSNIEKTTGNKALAKSIISTELTTAANAENESTEVMVNRATGRNACIVLEVGLIFALNIYYSTLFSLQL